MMSLDDFEWEWNHRTDAEKQKYEASLKVAHVRELAWLAEMAAKAAREATRLFRFTAPMNPLPGRRELARDSRRRGDRRLCLLLHCDPR